MSIYKSLYMRYFNQHVNCIKKEQFKLILDQEEKHQNEIRQFMELQENYLKQIYDLRPSLKQILDDQERLSSKTNFKFA